MYEGRKFRFKVSVIGDGGVGKTPLLKKFTTGSFEKDYVKTIGAQFSVFDKKIGDDKVRLIFWDIAGQNQFHFLRPSFFNNSKAAIIVYSLEDTKVGIESLNNVSNWNDDIRKYCGDIPIILFGNILNLDYDDTLYNSDIREIARIYNFARYYITSIESEQIVFRAFNEQCEMLYNKYKKLSKQNND
ncbi:MAG: GTP-binding protein [Candidatus Lokiarchaeota archaeon]|nr:GTP-binding protein [Candidatus Lokiarchaeota archaeon]